MKNQLLTVVMTFVVCSATAQVPDRVLLPITVRSVPGAYGSIWNTDLRILIEPTARDAVIVPLWSMSACDPPCPPGSATTIGKSVAIDFLRTHAGETPGSLMYLQADKAPQIHLALRLKESGREANAVELPVVREQEFSVSPIHIIAVPLSTASRAMLRVYGIDPDVLGTVRVRVFGENELTNENPLLGETVVALGVVQRFYTTASVHVPLRPPVAELNLSQWLPSTTGLVRVEIAPVEEGVRLWAFVAITDNATQDVTLRTPQ